MKYSFEKIDNDTTKLKYKEKEFEIKRNVGLLKEMQSAVFKAKKKLYFDLAKEGLTKKDLVISKKVGNKTYEDNTNVVDLENEYINEATLTMIDNLCNKYFNMTLTDLIQDLELDEKESEIFGEELMYAFTGNKKEVGQSPF